MNTPAPSGSKRLRKGRRKENGRQYFLRHGWENDAGTFGFSSRNRFARSSSTKTSASHGKHATSAASRGGTAAPSCVQGFDGEAEAGMERQWQMKIFGDVDFDITKKASSSSSTVIATRSTTEPPNRSMEPRFHAASARSIGAATKNQSTFSYAAVFD